MSDKLKSIMEAADRLTVRTIAQTPYCVTPQQPVSETVKYAQAEGYDWLPVCSEDGVIRRIVETRRIANLNSWSEVESRAHQITVDELVAGDAPIFSTLERFETRSFLLCLGSSGVDGIVTVFDLNRPAAHYFGFALAIVIESELGGFIEAALRGLDEDAVISLAARAGVGPTRTKEWKKSRRDSTQLNFTSHLSFGDKLKILRKIPLSFLASECELQEEALLQRLMEIKSLRNDVAHDKPALSNHTQVCRRLGIAHRLAHALTKSGDRRFSTVTAQ